MTRPSSSPNHFSIMQKSLLLSILTFVTLTWWACSKENLEGTELADHPAEFAFPLFNTSLKISDLVNNILQENATGDTIIFNPDKTITLFYSGDVSETKATSIFRFFENAIVPVDSSYSELPVKAPDGVTVYRADLSGGTLAVVIRNTLNEKIKVRFFIPNMSNNGAIYTTPLVEIAPGGVYITPQIELDGWALAAVDNLISFEYEAFLEDGTPILRIPPAQGVPAIFVTLQNLSFYYLEGYWGKVTYPLSTDTIDIDINQTNLNGNVQVKNPKVTITVFNSYGFPTRGLINYLRFRAKNGELLALESPLIQEGSEIGIDFDYPSFQAGEVGQTKETVFYFDDTNSNIADIFNSQPTQLIYQVEGLANADADPSLIGFLTDSSTVRLNVKVELLLEGQLQNFAADQTLNLDFGSFSAETPFETAEFKLVTENRMPLTSSLQVYFQNEAGVAIDSLFEEGPKAVIQSAPIEVSTGITTGTTQTDTYIPFSAERFERLRTSAKKAQLFTYFTTAQGGLVPVKILSDQGCIVKMGVRITRK